MNSNHKPIQSFKIVQFMMTIYRQRLTRILLPLAVLAFIIWEAGRELKSFNLARMLHELRRMDATFLIEIGLFSLIAVKRHERIRLRDQASFQATGQIRSDIPVRLDFEHLQ